MYKSIIDAVIQNSKRTPEKTALADSECSYSYQGLVSEVDRTARWFEQAGITSGDAVLVECTQNCVFMILDLACELSGIVFVPVEKKALEERVAHIYAETNAKCIIGVTDYSHIGVNYHIREILDFPEQTTGYSFNNSEKQNSAAEILFTTGTTGQPKGIIISHTANVAIAENIQKGVGMQENSVEIIPLPLSHSHGLRTCYAHLLNGSTAVIADGITNVRLFFHLMEQYCVNAIDISPTLAKLLFKIAKKGLTEYSDKIDYIEIGTAVLEDDTKEQMRKFFPKSRLYNFYGSTEAGRSCVLDFNHFDQTGCIGYPTRNAVFHIVDEGRKEIPDAEVPGLIAVSGAMMMEAYLGDPQLTESTLVDGILYTNDLGYKDKDGRIYIIGRKDDVINYKGIKIAPEEIETIASQYEGILDCACIPTEDQVCGQVPKLFVSLEPGIRFNADDFMCYLKSKLDQSRVPKYIEVIEKIPRSSNGKLQRKKLRDEGQK